jgi:hypothetical protein
VPHSSNGPLIFHNDKIVLIQPLVEAGHGRGCDVAALKKHG